MRVFVAVALPDRLREELGRLVAELRTSGADVRWVDPDSMHLTLKFLGDAEPDEIAAVEPALRRAAGAASPTGCRLQGVGSFPHLRRPRVIWAGVEADDDRLAALHSGIDAELAAIGFQKDKRRFHPHVTLGRVKGGEGKRALAAEVEARAEVELGRFRVEQFHLYESRLRSDGARHSILSTYRLTTTD